MRGVIRQESFNRVRASKSVAEVESSSASFKSCGALEGISLGWVVYGGFGKVGFAVFRRPAKTR
jgi:hypothetical protein